MKHRNDRLLTLGVAVCFFFSGAAGLVYQVLWTRMLGLFLGHTVQAITTVLAAFMAGLALGAYSLGRWIDRRGRPLRIYAALEAGTGLYCLLVPVLLSGAEQTLVSLSGDPAGPVIPLRFARFALLFLLLLPPTTFMGATFPVLGKLAVSRMGALGREIGDLYAFNTFGAVTGVVAAGFVLLPTIGMAATNRLAAVLNAAVAGVALILDHRVSLRREEAAPSASEGEGGGWVPFLAAPWLGAWGLALSGGASMIYEVGWTRALALAVGSSTYAFSTMLATFLTGLALGSFLFARLFGKRSVDIIFFGRLEIAIGVLTLLLVPLFGRLPELCLRVFQIFPPSHKAALLTQVFLSALVMIAPTILIGATLPAVASASIESLQRLGHGVGRLYAANTLGSIVGAAVAGFLLVPLVGVQRSLGVASVLNVVVGAAVLGVARRRVSPVFVSLPVLAGAFWLPGWNPAVMGSGVTVLAQRLVQLGGAAALRADLSNIEVLFYRDGANATVSVERTPRLTLLKVNGKTDASNGIDMLTQLALGHLPAVLHESPKRVLVIGLGSAVTVGAFTQHPVEAIDVVELEPAVVEASSFFSRENRDALRDPRVRLVLDDGRAFLRGARRGYDVISSEPSNPWMAGVANLFSVEFYQLCRQRLAPGGIMVQWVHGYSLFPEDLKMVVRTFREVFPQTTVWRTHRGDFLLVGSDRRLVVDLERVRARYEATRSLREDLAMIGWDSPLGILSLFLLDEDAAARYAADAPRNTDDLPLLEFSAPRALYADTMDTNDEMLREARTRRFPETGVTDGAFLDSAAVRLQLARVRWAWGERSEALRELEGIDLPLGGDLGLHVARARLLFALGRIEEGTANLHRLCFEAGIKDPLVASYIRAGRVLMESGFGAMVLEHGKAISGSPDPAEALNNLGVFYNSLGVRFTEPTMFDLAIDAFETAVTLAPQSYSARNNLGNAYFEKGLLDQARETYRQATEMRPQAAESHFNLGLVHQSQGANDLARSEYEKAVALRPDWDLPRRKLGGLERDADTRSAGAVGAH